ncbi:DapH/DapD/GlmU-related protein [Mesorhizobium sp. M1088]|uniref:acyltransferase n=1 Tax=Mesorhizobium sp. M1088 TaxID=2957056 RepID=UPI00333A7C88
MIAGKITVGDGSWIGANSIVLRGAVIGHDSIVGAGSVVKKAHDPGSIIVGVPGNAIRRRW